MFGYPRAGDVGVRTRRALIGEHPTDARHRVIVETLHVLAQRSGEIVGIGYAHRAFAGGDAAELVRISSGRVSGPVVPHPFGPLRRRFAPLVSDDRRQQGQHVDVAGAAGADHPLHLGIGDGIIGLEVQRIHPVLVVEQDAEPLGEAVPLAFGVTQPLRYAGVQHLRRDGLQKTRLVGAPDASRIHGQQHVGGAVGALGLHPLDKGIRLVFDAVDLDVGGLLEIGVQPLIRVVVAGGVEVQFPRRLRLRHGKQRQPGGGGDQAGNSPGNSHWFTPCGFHHAGWGALCIGVS